MKEIPNKYCGKRIDTGETVYGDLYQGAVTKIITRTAEYRVYPQSVMQLAGYDRDGNEIYKCAGWDK